MITDKFHQSHEFPDLSLSECLKHVKITEILAKRGHGSIAGMHQSHQKGDGIDYTDIREYHYGDDPRAIDWNVTARFGRPHIREFQTERDHTFYLVIDRSASASFGSEQTKEQTMLNLSVSLIFSAISHHDAVGLCLCTDSVERFIPARKGRQHAMEILRTIVSHRPQSPLTDLSAAFHFLSATIKRQVSVLILSDFLSLDYEKSLRILAKRHEVFALRITDPCEERVPDIGLIELEDPETGEQVLFDTSNPAIQSAYEESVVEESEIIRETCIKAGARYLSLNNDTTSLHHLSSLFSREAR